VLAKETPGQPWPNGRLIVKREGHIVSVLDVQAKDVGIMDVFSGWHAAVTYYANCAGFP